MPRGGARKKFGPRRGDTTLVKPLNDNVPPGYRRANKAGHCGHAAPDKRPVLFPLRDGTAPGTTQLLQ